MKKGGITEDLEMQSLTHLEKLFAADSKKNFANACFQYLECFSVLVLSGGVVEIAPNAPFVVQKSQLRS